MEKSMHYCSKANISLSSLSFSFPNVLCFVLFFFFCCCCASLQIINSKYQQQPKKKIPHIHTHSIKKKEIIAVSSDVDSPLEKKKKKFIAVSSDVDPPHKKKIKTKNALLGFRVIRGELKKKTYGSFGLPYFIPSPVHWKFWKNESYPPPIISHTKKGKAKRTQKSKDIFLFVGEKKKSVVWFGSSKQKKKEKKLSLWVQT